MPSIISGYEYDIFISYRQKDNKQDGWVTEFIDTLKDEIEATFKEDISIYFDENPHDGLGDTHDVDDSLAKKLKCLIFIPIISQTYCDPNSFAWTNEFLAFNELAKNDEYGFKVQLPNGNTTTRVLPIRIHDLDNEDKQLLENEIGFLRSIDFIYQSAGVNRPLRAKEDDPNANLNKTYYRDQINKVANAIKGIIAGIKTAETTEESDSKETETLTPKKTQLTSELKRDLGNKAGKKGIPLYAKVISIILILGIITVFYLQNLQSNKRREKIEWAYQTAIPEIESLVAGLRGLHHQGGSGPEAWEAFYLSKKVEEIIPDDPKLKELQKRCSWTISITSTPEGASVFAKPYLHPDSSFKFMGKTPLVNILFPSGNLSLKIKKDGFETIEDLIWLNGILGMNGGNYVMDSVGSIPENMSMVRPNIDTMLWTWLRLQPFIDNPDEFMVDQFEVSNKDYKEFANAGGYKMRNIWKESFFREGKEITWEQAMSFFVDQTGRPGPSTWVGGDYPEGEDDHPVAGVSWYEAMAYAEFVGKQLPSVYHARLLSGSWAINEIAQRSNLGSSRTTKREQNHPQNLWGVSDLFGNLREWCYNKRDDQFRSIVGGAYEDQEYLANNMNIGRLAFDRSAGNGFRCIKSIKHSGYESPLYAEVTLKFPDYYKETPVSSEIFKLYLNQFTYDKVKMNPNIVYRRDVEDWIREKVEFEAPYGQNLMSAYIFLPKNVKPPYQTIIYWPGSAATWYDSSEEYLEIGQFDFLIKNGRAVIVPVYAGTYERRNVTPRNSDCEDWRVCDKERIIKMTMEVHKSIDYLETRDDIDLSNLGYYGISWGAANGPIPLASEPRIKLAILAYGGLRNYRPFPEVDIFNYLPQIKIPVLLLNGRYDFILPLKESIKPFFDHLGTTEEHKKLMLYDDGHFVPKNELIKESLSFLDTYFGEVEKLNN